MGVEPVWAIPPNCTFGQVRTAAPASPKLRPQASSKQVHAALLLNPADKFGIGGLEHAKFQAIWSLS